MHYSTKRYGHEQGLSAVFRQPNASHSHCQLLHGYSLAFTFTFSCKELDDKNWVVDFGGLKLKLVSSIVAISGIHLLKIFFGLENYTQSQVILFIAVHFTFVLSGVLLAYMDSLTAKGKK